MKYYLTLLCIIVLFLGNTVSFSDDKHIIKNKYKIYLQKIDEANRALKLGNADKALMIINQVEADWKSQQPEIRRETDEVISRVFYLEVHALYKSGKKSLVPASLKKAIFFEREQKIIFRPLQADYGLFKEIVTSFVNSCGDNPDQYPEITEYALLRDLIFFKTPPDNNLIAALFRSNDLTQEPGEFSIVLLYRQNKQGIYEPSELKIPRTKYHTLTLEEGTGGIPNIILRKKFGRTGEVETITVGIQDGLKIISQDRK